MKCRGCQHLKGYILGPDECGSGNMFSYCALKHWEGGDTPDWENITAWDNCEDFLKEKEPDPEECRKCIVRLKCMTNNFSRFNPIKTSREVKLYYENHLCKSFKPTAQEQRRIRQEQLQDIYEEDVYQNCLNEKNKI